MSSEVLDVEDETVADHPLLTKQDLRTFDGDAFDLVTRAQDAGWRGYLTKRSHVFLKAPDGVATMSVSRDSLRGRSGRNAKAVLDRWLKARELTSPDPSPASPGASFGTPTPLPDSFTAGGWAPGALAEARRQGVTEWLLDHPDLRAEKDWSAWIDPNGDPKRWFVVDMRGHAVVVKGRGAGISELEVRQIVHAKYPWVFTTARRDPQDQGGNTMRVLLCDHEGCDYRSEHAGAMNLHRSKHNQTLVTCQHPGCGRQMSSSTMGLHEKSHTDNEPTKCGVCGKILVGQRGLRTHGSRSHAGVPFEEVASVGSPVATGDDTPVTDGAVTVAPPVQQERPAARAVLLEHLEHVPEGADAEQQIASVRAIVAGPLVAELRRLSEDNERLELQVKELTDVNGELQAKLSLMREALGL